LPETARFLGLGRRKSQPRDDTSAAISQFDIDLQFFSLTFCASSITLLAWLSNGAAITGHPAILSITQLALLQRNPKREMA